MSKITLPQYRFEGTHKEIGHAHGETLRSMIQGFTESRFEAAKQYFQDEKVEGKTPEGLKDLAKECLRILEKWDPEGFEEHVGIAEGSNVDSASLFVATGYTDLRDAYMLAGDKPDSEGCTAVMIPKSQTKDGSLIGAQTWDLNPNDLDYVVAIQACPKNQPARWSISTAGCLSLMGMNSEGVATGTTNIKTYGSKPGVSYINILHRTLRMKDPEEILSMIGKAPRSGAHTYWIVNRETGWEYETSPNSFVSFPLENQSRVWTNHCLAPEHVEIEYQKPSDSTLKRRRRMQELISNDNIDIEQIQQAFADRADGVDSINRLPEDKQGTSTNACMIAIPEKKVLWACKGPADQGEWVQLGFDHQT